jgi:hypothetical protein
MAIAFVQEGHGSVTSASPFFAWTALNITTGNFIVVGLKISLNTTVSGVSDNATPSSNTYALAITKSDATNNQTVSIWYAQIVNGGGTKPTVTASLGASAVTGVSLYEFSGVASSSPIDVPGASSVTGSSGTAVTSTAMASTSNAADLLFGLCVVGGATSAGEAGWTMQTDAQGNACEFFITSTTGAYAATFTQTSASIYTAAVASFKPPSGGGGGAGQRIAVIDGTGVHGISFPA